MYSVTFKLFSRNTGKRKSFDFDFSVKLEIRVANNSELKGAHFGVFFKSRTFLLNSNIKKRTKNQLKVAPMCSLAHIISHSASRSKNYLQKCPERAFTRSGSFFGPSSFHQVCTPLTRSNQVFQIVSILHLSALLQIKGKKRPWVGAPGYFCSATKFKAFNFFCYEFLEI